MDWAVGMKVSRCLELVGSIITYLSLLELPICTCPPIKCWGQPQTYSVNGKVGDVTFEYKGSLSNDILLNDVSEHWDTHVNLPQHQHRQQTGRHEFEGEYIIQVDYLQLQYTFHCQDLLNPWMLHNQLVTWISNQYFSVPHRFLQDSQDSWGFPRIPQDSSWLLYNFGDFELVETNTDKSPGILRTGTEFLLN